jgi:hypothetical protein
MFPATIRKPARKAMAAPFSRALPERRFFEKHRTARIGRTPMVESACFS